MPLDQTTSDNASMRLLIWTGYCNVAVQTLETEGSKWYSVASGKTRPDAPVDWVTVDGTFCEQVTWVAMAKLGVDRARETHPDALEEWFIAEHVHRS